MLKKKEDRSCIHMHIVCEYANMVNMCLLIDDRRRNFFTPISPLNPRQHGQRTHFH
jgi:hypothetical protein